MIYSEVRLGYFLGLVLASGLGFAGTNDSALLEKKAEAPATYVVGKGPLKQPVQLDGVFEAAEMKPVKLDSLLWSPRIEAALYAEWTVLEAVPHGTPVKKGDVLVKLDPGKIAVQIEDLEQVMPEWASAVELAQTELKNLEQTTPLKIQAGQRILRETDDELNRFQKTGRAEQEKAAKFGVRKEEQDLANAKEELKQLKQMYRAKDLTEETEEIILKRQKFAVDSAERALETKRLSADWELNIMVPRWDRYWKTKKQEDQIAADFSEQSLPMLLAKKRLEVEKLKRDQKKLQQRLADLKKGLEWINLRAPQDGLVFYGAWDDGKWSTGATVAKRLVPGGKVYINEVVMTVVDPAKLVVKASVPESELSRVQAGSVGEGTRVSEPDRKFPVTVEAVGEIPLPGGGYQATLSFRRESAMRLVPGMLCKVSVPAPPSGAVLLAWTDSVFTEGKQKFVYVQKTDSQFEKRKIKTGDSNDKMIEVLEGLDEGDKIQMKKPE